MNAEDTRIPHDIAEALVDPAVHADHRIHDALKWLRANNPLGYAGPEKVDPFWVVTRQADIKTIAMDNDSFHNGDRNITLIDREQEKRLRELTGRSSPVRTIIQMDQPDHAKYRAVTAPFLRPANLAKLEDGIRAIAKESIGHMVSLGGECDFAKDVAFMYPLRVIMSVLGVPREDERLMLKLTQEFFGFADADQARDAVTKTGKQAAEELATVAEEFGQYFDRLMDLRRADPRNDVISVIANSLIDGKRMPKLEARSYCQVAATAGHDTTSASTAGGVWALAEHSDQWARVSADRSLIPGLVEEAIRWTSPSKYTMRSASRDIELCGRSFRKNDWIALFWASANRDEAVFEDPFAFRVDRSPNRLLAFGWGAHNCVGQHLARMEMRILFEELFAAVREIELAGEPANLASLFVAGPKRLPIRYKLY